MSEDSVTVMLQPEDDTETILEKVRRTGAKKVSLIVPPGTKALQTLGGFTMLRKASDITGIEVTVYSIDEKTCDMARVCRFDVVHLEQETRPREVPPVEEPRIIVSTRPPEPTGVAGPTPDARPSELEDRLGSLSAEDLALFDALEGMSQTEDVELRPDAFTRPVARATEETVAAPPPQRERPVQEPRPAKERPAKEKPAKKPSLLKKVTDPLVSALGNVYIAVVGAFLSIASRFQGRKKDESQKAVAAETAPAGDIGTPATTEEEREALRRRRIAYTVSAILAVVGFTVLVVIAYFAFQPVVWVELTPRQAETQNFDVDILVVISDTGSPDVKTVDGIPMIQAKQVTADLQDQSIGQATGHSTVAEGTATGAVVFVNLTSYGMNVPAGTQLTVQGGGVTFHTTQEVFVPASDFRGVDAYLGKAQVNIVADIPGSAGNVPAAAVLVIQSDLGSLLTVENTEATQGGSERQVTIITAEDQERLRQQLIGGLREQANAKLREQIGEGETILEGTLQIDTVQEDFSQPVGSEAVTFTLSARVTAQALASSGDVLDTAISQAAHAKVDPTLNTGQVMTDLSHGAVSAVGPSGKSINDNRWTYRTHVTAPIENEINAALRSEITRELRGKSAAEADKTLAQYVTDGQIAGYAISPVLPKLPRLWGIRVLAVQ